MKLQTTIELEGSYLKAATIEQNSDGSKFALAYNDNGEIKLVVFDLEKELFQFNVSQHFGFEFKAMPLSGLFNPFAVCCFIDDEKIFFSFFHKKAKNHYHFILDTST